MSIASHPVAGLAQMRDAMAVAIVRRLVNGEDVPEWALADFAEADSEAGYSFESSSRPGAAFGL
jgi:hypothetical protein